MRASSPPLGLALFGYGYMGHVYRKAFHQLKDEKLGESYYKIDMKRLLASVKLAAVVDPQVAAEDRKDLESHGVKIFRDRAELFASKVRIHAAVIASPIPTHFDLAKDCLERGISLLVEKPVCPTGAEIRALDRLARSKGLVLLPAHVERYNPVCLDAKETVDFRLMGKVERYVLRRCSEKPERVRESLVIDKLIHDVDLAHSLFGAFEVVSVKSRKKGGEVMHVEVSTSHAKGFTGIIVSSWMIAEKERSVQIFFERGRLHGDLLAKKLKIFRQREFSKEITGYANNQIKDQLLDFLACLRHPTTPLVHIRDALRAAKVIDRVTELVE